MQDKYRFKEFDPAVFSGSRDAAIASASPDMSLRENPSNAILSSFDRYEESKLLEHDRLDAIARRPWQEGQETPPENFEEWRVPVKFSIESRVDGDEIIIALTDSIHRKVEARRPLYHPARVETDESEDRPELVNVAEFSDAELPPEVSKALRETMRTGRIAEPLRAYSSQPFETVSRSINLVYPGYDYVLTIGGLGLITLEDNVITIQSPLPTGEPENFSEYMSQQYGMSPGTSYYGQQGEIHRDLNEDPTGGYPFDHLIRKISNTRKAHGLLGHVATVPQVALFGKYLQGERQLGVWAYKTPLHILSSEFISLCQTYDQKYADPKVKTVILRPFGYWVYSKLKAMGELHKMGIVHNQMHEGNEGVVIANGYPMIIMKDFGTLQNIREHSREIFARPSYYETTMSPVTAAMIRDIVHTLHYDILTIWENTNFSSHYPDHVSRRNPHYWENVYAGMICAWARAGYLSSPGSQAVNYFPIEREGLDRERSFYYINASGRREERNDAGLDDALTNIVTLMVNKKFAGEGWEWSNSANRLGTGDLI